MTDSDVANNAERFRTSLGDALANNINSTSSSAKKIDEAYGRLTSLQAWRTFVLEQELSPGALGFYSEAQNDGLTSNVLVTIGMWRSSLKSLRSIIENIIHTIYYNDHVVEYRNWEEGRHRPPFSKLFEYLDDHPDILALPSDINPVAPLRNQYKKLSNVVHSSSKNFRMSDEGNHINIWKTNTAALGQWSSIQKELIREINLLLIAIFKNHLHGAKHKGLREALAIVFPASRDSAIHSAFGVRIIR